MLSVYRWVRSSTATTATKETHNATVVRFLFCRPSNNPQATVQRINADGRSLLRQWRPGGKTKRPSLRVNGAVAKPWENNGFVDTPHRDP